MERKQVARKEAEKSAEINLPGNGRRKPGAQPAERRLKAEENGQLDWSAARIEPEGQSATGAEAGGWSWSLWNASCMREWTGRLPWRRNRSEPAEALPAKGISPRNEGWFPERSSCRKR